MLPRERVATVIAHGKPDRLPIYGWLFANLEKPLTERFGSVAAFEDRYEFDLAHLFGGPDSLPDLKALRQTNGGVLEPAMLRDISLRDPNDQAKYASIKAGLAHHKTRRGRFVYVQTPGIFEHYNKVFGIEDHLMYLALYPDELKHLYQRQAEWNRTFAMNCLDLGADMVHVSDDWGSQRALMFSPKMWRELIYPYHKITCDAVRRRNAYLSLHSCGCVNQVLDGIIELGYQVLHPYQESAGMDFKVFQERYARSLTVMGGLDIQTTLGCGDRARLEREIRRVVSLFKDGGLLLCTTHFVQEHCSMDELCFAYDLIHELIHQPAAR